MEHRRVSFVAVDEWFNIVAGDEGVPHQLADRVHEVIQVACPLRQQARKLFLTVLEVGGCHLFLGVESFSQQDSPASQAVDAEHEIDGCTDQGSERDETDPEGGGPGIALVEQGMHRRHQRNSDRYCQGHVLPIVRERGENVGLHPEREPGK